MDIHALNIRLKAELVEDAKRMLLDYVRLLR